MGSLGASSLEPRFLGSAWEGRTFAGPTVPSGPAPVEGGLGDAEDHRQFLANLAWDLVQRFRREEAELHREHPRLLAHRRQENRALIQALRELMAKAELGLEVSAGIRHFLGQWQALKAGRLPDGSAAEGH